jgi:hypothetical protein
MRAAEGKFDQFPRLAAELVALRVYVSQQGERE